MRARRLSSSLIERIVFDDDAQTLLIQFRHTGRYLYHGVPRAIYDALGRAQSAGAYFNEAIKGRFACERTDRRRRYPLA
jgi:hypothetical protein